MDLCEVAWDLLNPRGEIAGKRAVYFGPNILRSFLIAEL
jgi:hypothetical protein